jgi:hypothetical protein
MPDCFGGAAHAEIRKIKARTNNPCKLKNLQLQKIFGTGFIFCSQFSIVKCVLKKNGGFIGLKIGSNPDFLSFSRPRACEKPRKFRPF